MKFLTTRETAVKWGVSRQMVLKYATGGHIPGAILKDGRWMIPENTEQHASSNEFPDTEAAADKQILLDNLLRAFSAA